jgi:hypothetical protein
VAEANWPLLQAGLTEAAQSVGENATFEQVQWTGKNRASARQGAANSILLHVEKLRGGSSSEGIFVIGHSHGGSAIAYFLKKYSEAARNVVGCAFLSTPFIAVRPRMSVIESYTTLSALLVSAPGILVSIAYFPPWAILTIQGVFGFVIWAFKEFFLKRSAVRLQCDAIEEQTADLPAANYFFIRASGDEAAAALSAAQFVAWASTKVYAAVERLTAWYPVLQSIRSGDNSKKARWTERLDSLVATVLWVWVLSGGLLLANIVIHELFQNGLHYFISAESLLLLGIWVLAMLIALVVVVSVTAAFFVLAAQAIMARAFGWTGLAAGLLTELAIEPVPFGNHLLVHIDWSTKRSVVSDGIVHSWTYSHPLAVEHIKSWVISTLKSR